MEPVLATEPNPLRQRQHRLNGVILSRQRVDRSLCNLRVVLILSTPRAAMQPFRCCTESVSSAHADENCMSIVDRIDREPAAAAGGHLLPQRVLRILRLWRAAGYVRAL